MSSPKIRNISCQELYHLNWQEPVELIDVRTPEEFREVRASLARNLPMDQLDPVALASDPSRSGQAPLYFICKMGGRSAHVCRQMIEAGYANVFNVRGGTDAWLEAGLPIELG
jgi:rhodanese-related sulfurtransferase